MDLSLLQGPAATPPAMPPVSSKTVGEGGDDGAFDALVDEAVLGEDEDAEIGSAPAFVVAPVKEPWIDLVIRGPIAPPESAPAGQPGPVSEPAGNAVIPPPGAGVPVVDDLPLGPKAEAAETPAAAVDGGATSTPATTPPDPAFAAALSAAASSQDVPDAPAAPEAPQVSADRPASTQSVDGVRPDRPDVASQLTSQPPKAPSAAARAVSAERRAAEQVLQQAMAPAVDTPQAPAQSTPQADPQAAQSPKPIVVAPPSGGKGESSTPAPGASAPFAVNARAAIEAFARQEAQGEGQSSRGGAERGFADQLTSGSPALHTSSTSPTMTAAAFAAMVDGPLPLAAADAAANAAPAETLADVPDLLPQFVKGIQMQWRGALGEARLELQPPHLGPVTVDLQVGPDGVDATLSAESPLVRGWIEAHEGDLRAGLAGQGLQLASLTVTADPQEQRRRQSSRDGQGEPDRRNADPTPENWQDALSEQGLAA